MNKIDLNALRDRAYKIACNHGFHDKELSNEHCLMLVITELSEAVEADRKGKHFDFLNNDFDHYCRMIDKNGFNKAFEECVKDTVSDELADAAIRLLDLAALRNIDLEMDIKYLDNWINATAESCKNKTFTESIYNISSIPARANVLLFKDYLRSMLFAIFGLSKHLDIALLWHIEQKMKYNELREKMHGKKY